MKRFLFLWLFLFFFFGFYFPLLGQDHKILSSSDFEGKEEETSKEKVSDPLIHLFSFRLSLETAFLRGTAFEFLNNSFGYDQVVGEIGLGVEMEITYRATKYWRIYGSLDYLSFGSAKDHVNLKDTTTGTVSFIPIEFQGWTLVSFLLGGKFYPFEEEYGLLPFIKVGFGFTYQTDLKQKYQGVETKTPLESRIGLTLETGLGLEYKFSFRSMVLGIAFEAILVRLTKQNGGLLRGTNNTYAFPMNLGIIIYF